MSNSHTIFIAGFLSFLILNLVENIIYYSMGRSFEKKFSLKLPNRNDFIKLFIIMILFAMLQGGLTSFIDSFE
jgi:hypothetical protein